MVLDVIVVDAPDRVDDRLAVAAFVVVFTLFALFLPNSSYLVTELGHLREPSEEIPTWYDVIAVLSLTMCGVLLCCVSLAYVHLILDLSVVGATWSWVIVAGYLVLANFGIYIGRQLRFNSWDTIVRPGNLLVRTGRHLLSRAISPKRSRTRWRSARSRSVSFSSWRFRSSRDGHCGRVRRLLAARPRRVTGCFAVVGVSSGSAAASAAAAEDQGA